MKLVNIGIVLTTILFVSSCQQRADKKNEKTSNKMEEKEIKTASAIPDVLDGKIILNGENPFIWLSEEQGSERTTEASIWTITYSEKGAGHILLVKSELTDNQWKIYSDNEALARWMQSGVQGMLNPETTDLNIPVFNAEFAHSGDTKNQWIQKVKTDNEEIVMTWNNMSHPILVQDEGVSTPERPYRVNAVMIPAQEATLTINGKQAKGKIWPMNLNGSPFSTGALAFSESWRKE